MKENNWAIVPVKVFSAGKSRLSALFSVEQREQLSQAMLFDVFSALSNANGLNGVIVVTDELDGIRMSHQFGFHVLADNDANGPTQAISNALTKLQGQACSGVLALMADLPLITSDDVTRLLTNHKGRRAVTLAPSLDRLGTNAAFCTPPGVIALTFNGRGFAEHLNRAGRAGVETNVVDLQGVALDLDQPADIASLIDIPSASKTRAIILELLENGQIPPPLEIRKMKAGSR